ncbi:MAG: glycoside hydrolase family 30 protein [Solirubrobacteraceae bacterium]
MGRRAGMLFSHPNQGYGSRRARPRGPRVPFRVAGLVLVAVPALAAASGGILPGTNPRNPAIEVVQTSADLAQRMTRLPDLSWRQTPPHGVPVIHVDERVRYQRLRGFGAAMTDTSAWLIEDQLAPPQRTALVADLFGPRGIGLSFLRIAIGASDFTKDEQAYSYDDMPPGRTDPGLRHFSIAHDRAYILPALRQAFALDPHIWTLANAWSPPGWMKSNDSLNNRANGGTLRSTDYGPLARYLIKFIRAYERAGVPIDAITPNNEPQNPTRYPGLQLEEASEVRLITRNLVPDLRAAGLSTAVFGQDAGWTPRSVAYAHALATSSAAHMLQGIAWHCYFGEPTQMAVERNIDPRLEQILDECSPGLIPSISEITIGSIRNWATAVALWNLALDPQGGPVQPPNNGCPYCAGVVTVDPSTHRFRENINFFQLGQASKFIRPGAQRIHAENFVSYVNPPKNQIASAGLDDVALRNTDGSKVLLAYNNSSTQTTRFAVVWRRRWFTYILAPKATVTFVWDRPR